MSLALVGRSASYEFRWRRWALLRDTLAALEPAPECPHFYSIGNALVTQTLRIPAAELIAEIREIQGRLRGGALELLSIGPATASILYMGAKLVEPRRLSAHELSQVAPVEGTSDLADYFASMCGAILDVCAEPFEDGHVEAIDG